MFSSEKKHVCNFGKGNLRNNSENNFEFGPVVQEEMSLKDISIKSSGSPFVPGADTLCNFGGRHHEDNSVKLFYIWANGSGGDVVSIYLLSGAL